jgi:hypothetical protein
MSCCSKKKTHVKVLEDVFEPRSILKNKRYKTIYPLTTTRKKKADNKVKLKEKSENRQEFIDKFNSEILACGGCHELFKIGDNAIKTSCASCDKFFHCHIAGACIGSNCSVILDGEKHSLKYCMSCVNPYLKINIEDNGQCLCKKCEDLSDIPNYYKDV